ncbi:MAG: hypothetical protein M5U23_13300 [Acidimicrobiia bacterium]|nr:hypothetical protein [Acidimicrobiia bacterium]
MVTDRWVFAHDDWRPDVEGRRESLTTLGNGLFATRGAAPESSADAVHYPGTYAAGVYNRLVSKVGDDLFEEHESMVNLPNWLPLTFRAEGGDWFGSPASRIIDYRQELDLRSGMLTRMLTVSDSDDHETMLHERRIVSMADPHLAGLEWTITPLNWDGEIEIRSWLDGGVENRNVADYAMLASRHLDVIATGETEPGTMWLEAETVQSHVRCVEAARTAVSYANGRSLAPLRLIQKPLSVGYHFEGAVGRGESMTVEKVISLFTSNDWAISEARTAAIERLADVAGFSNMLAAHVLAWRHLWRRCRVDLNGASNAAQTLNLHAFHVLQTVSPNVDLVDAGVPARGLHGEGYRGHIFWDEIFVFPFFNLRIPELTRTMLLYRYRRLPAARRMAKRLGYDGTMFPWQSGSDGREETPDRFFNPISNRWMPDNSQQQRHVGLAIAYNVWHYYQTTGDIDFLVQYGAEMLVGICRFFASLATFDPVDERYHLNGVIGPDEFHDGYPDRPGEGINDNAYTNVLAAWVFQRAIETFTLLSVHHRGGDLWERLDMSGDEIASWDTLSRRMAVPFLDNGVIAQFEGFGDLKELDWDQYRARYGNIGRLDLILEAEGDATNCYKVTKQADVLMLLYLFDEEELGVLLNHLGYELPSETIPATIDYYVARSSNGSTLSRVVHAWVLSRYDRLRSWHTFLEALGSDVADIQGGTTREGIHLGAMAGTLSLIQRYYLGTKVRHNLLWLDPHLPEELDHLATTLHYRGHWLDITVDNETLTVESRECDASPISIRLLDQHIELEPGQTVSVSLG